MIRLAWANILHRLTRTGMTVFAMAIAAAVATSGMSLSRGVARMADKDYRDYYGGDILVFTPTFVGASPVYDAESTVSRAILSDSGFNALVQLYPQFVTEGYLQYDKYPYSPIPPQQIAKLAEHPGVHSLQLNYVFPALISNRDVKARVFSPAARLKLVEGKEPSDRTGVLEIVVNAYGGPTLGVGDKVELSVPVMGLGASSVPYADFTSIKTYEAVVVGVVKWPTRELMYQAPGAGTEPIYEQGYVHSPEVYFTEAEWQRLWGEQAGGQPYPVMSLSVSVNNLADLNSIAASLRAAFTALTIKTVPEVARHVERYNLLDYFYRIPRSHWLNEHETVTQDYLPVELGFVSSILLFASAGMLLAGQMLAAITERKKEIGVLKALGARSREIVGMILAEGLLLSTSGSLIGFLFIRLLGVHRDISNSIGWATILRTTLVEMGVVMGMTTSIALLFSALPAARMARLSVMEVFRNE